MKLIIYEKNIYISQSFSNSGPFLLQGRMNGYIS